MPVKLLAIVLTGLAVADTIALAGTTRRSPPQAPVVAGERRQGPRPAAPKPPPPAPSPAEPRATSVDRANSGM